MGEPFDRLSDAIAASHRRTDEVAEGLQELRVEVREGHRRTDEVAEGLQELRVEVREGRRRTDEVAEGLQELRVEVREGRRTTDDLAKAVQNLGVELRSHMDSVADRLRRDLTAYTDHRFEENRRHFQVLAEDLRGDIRLVAEGVITVDEKVDRGFAELRREIADGRAETRALFANHERRIQALEQR